jgi:hypothetical protein
MYSTQTTCSFHSSSSVHSFFHLIFICYYSSFVCCLFALLVPRVILLSQPVINHPVIDDREILGLPPLKAPKKKTGKGHHSCPVLESVTEEKKKVEKGAPKLVYHYPALEDTDNWKIIILISVF